MLAGLVRPTSGQIALFGRDATTDVQVRSKVGTMVETPAFYKYLTGRQNLAVLARQPAQRAEIDASLEEVGLIDRADEKVKNYSHGMRQRLGLALAMLGDPELVILDEPTNGLDPEGTTEIRQIIRELAAQRGVTVFLSSHLLHEIEQICGRVGIISRGRLIAEGQVADLLGSSGQATVSVDRPDAAAKAAAGLDFVESAQVSGDVVRVCVKDGRLADLNAFLVARGFRVSALTPRKKTLEELYLSILQDETMSVGSSVDAAGGANAKC